jgi:hypothetical protein
MPRVNDVILAMYGLCWFNGYGGTCASGAECGPVKKGGGDAISA